MFEDYVANTLFKNSVTGHYVQHSVCPVVQITRYHTVFRTPQNNPNLVFKINDIFLTQVLGHRAPRTFTPGRGLGGFRASARDDRVLARQRDVDIAAALS